MTQDTVLLLREIGPGIGAGIIFAAVLCIGASALGLARTASGMSWLIAAVVWVIVICICVSMWSQNHHGQLNVAGLKMVGGIIGVVAGAVILGLIVQRAPDYAILTIFCVLVGCGLIFGLVMFAPTHNLIILLLIVLVLALFVAAGMAVWAIDRRHAREVQAPRPMMDHTPQQAYLPPQKQEEYRGRLLSSPKSNLPAVRNNKGRWLT